MPNLFIIGNGFDLAHKLPTSYSNFRTFLQEEYGADEDADLIPPDNFVGDFADMRPDKNEIANLIARLARDACKKENWADFETAMGYFNYDDFFENVEKYDRDGDIDYFKTNYIKKDIADDLLRYVPLVLKELFQEWVKSVNISKDIPKSQVFKKLINPASDLFLSFNYTPTLETIYSSQNVCHIHGKREKEIYLGHGDDNVGNYEECFWSSDEILIDLKQELQKDTEKVLSLHQDFFNGLTTIDSVYSIGFSYNDIDLCYIEKICNVTGSRITKWVLNDFDDEGVRKQFEERIRKCGYTGSFETQQLV